MRLLIIRHGESEADILDVHEGRADFPLTERGHRQAQAMAEYVSANFDLAKIYCSTLTRAKQTATYLSKASGIELTPDDMLMEFNNGLIAGLDRETAERRYPSVKDLPIHAAVYEQESVLEFRFRADFMLSKIISENDADSTVAVVTHGGMITQLIRSILRLPVDCENYFWTGDTGIHIWRLNGNNRSCERSNFLEHVKGI